MKIDIDYAKTFLGKPYVWGGESDKGGGYDCSGFAYNVFKKSSPIKRTTAQGYYDMFKDYEVNKNNVYAGDVLFFGKSKKNITHIAFAISSTEMIESIGTSKNTIKNKGKGVTISKITRRKDLVAVCRFENVSRETLKVARPTLKRGNRGIEVSNLQKCLNYVGGYNLVTDGILGMKTYYALCDFQLRYRLSVDGIYGNHTYNKMRELIGGV